MWKTMNKHFNLHTKGFFFSLRGTISFWEQVKAQDDEDKRSTCSNLYAKPHTKPLKNINIWLCLWCTDRLSVCRSRNPTIINVFSTINYKKREKVRKREEECCWLYLGPVVPSPESWLPASLGVPADLAVGDKGPGTEGRCRQAFYLHINMDAYMTWMQTCSNQIPKEKLDDIVKVRYWTIMGRGINK